MLDTNAWDLPSRAVVNGLVTVSDHSGFVDSWITLRWTVGRRPYCHLGSSFEETETTLCYHVIRRPFQLGWERLPKKAAAFACTMHLEW